VTWSSATDLAWAKSNNVTTGVDYTLKRSTTDDFTNARTIHTGTDPSGTATTASITDTGKNPTYRTNTIVTGSNFSCALTHEGSAFCWGANTNGQLGNETNAPSTTPTKVLGAVAGKTLVTLSAAPSGNHVCAVDVDGVAYCWGLNSSGQLGSTTSDPSNVAVPVSTTGVLKDKKVATISAGNNFTCATDTAGVAYCWGANASKQLGVTSPTTPSLVPVAVDATAALKGKFLISVSAGSNSVCALDTEGLAYCWGAAANGVLGNGTTTGTFEPAALTTSGALKGKTLQQISVGTSATCAIDIEQAAYCWSTNSLGQLGTNDTKPSYTPVLVPTTEKFVSITVGFATVCATTSAGALYCWGQNQAGQFSTDTTAASVLTPTRAGTTGTVAGKAVTSVSTAQSWSCFITSDGVASCSGANAQGALGNSPTTSSTTSATVVAAVTDTIRFSKVASVSPNGCGISLAGKAYCWGTGTDGALGNGTSTTTQYATAVDTTGLLENRTVTDISIGGATTAKTVCAIADGSLFCWGSNTGSRLLGIGSTSSTPAMRPVAVNVSQIPDVPGQPAGTKPKFKQLSLSANRACAVTEGNKLYCWGSSIGVGPTNTNTTRPQTAVSGDYTSVTSGAAHACAVSTGQQAYCWGANTYGQLGNGTTQNSVTPVYGRISNGIPVSNVTKIAIVGQTTCMLDGNEAGSLYSVTCYGNNANGETGVNTNNAYYVFAVSPNRWLYSDQSVMDLAGYLGTFCALATDGQFCWGYGGTDSAMGDGSANTDRRAPVQISSGDAKLSTVQSLGSGNTPCIVTTSGSVHCWGPNNGAYGNGGTSNYSSPVLSARTPATPATYSQYVQKCATGSVSIGNSLCSLRDTGAYNYQLQYVYKQWPSTAQVVKRP
jgi:alpha-tubulin suppressor-like RCC1 family protein